MENLDRQNKKLTQSLIKRGVDPNNFVRVQDLLPIINELETEINNIPTPSVQPLVYKALLTQSGTDAPVATVLENTLGGVPVWSLYTTGVIEITLTGAFPINKTVIYPPLLNSTDGFNGYPFLYDDEGVDANSRKISSSSGLNIIGDNVPIYIYIEVYP
jgi:hypothetical protein